MLWIPQKGQLRVQHSTGSGGVASPGTAVTTGGTSSTKGAWTELIASTTFDAYLVYVNIHSYRANATASDLAVDIAIGASGSEQIIIPDLLAGYAPSGIGVISSRAWLFPLHIPVGTRISARGAGDRVSATFRAVVFLYGGAGIPPLRVGGTVTTYGMGTVPNGTAVTPGSSGAEGSWVQIAASTSANHYCLLPSFQANSDSSLNNNAFQVDIGVGASGVEQEIGSWWFAADNAENMSGPMPCLPVFIDIPSGSRLAMRASNSGTNDAGYTGVIHAI